MFFTTMETKFGRLTLVGSENGLSRILFEDDDLGKYPESKYWVRNDAFFDEIIAALNDYFAGNLKRFEFALDLPNSSAFHNKVWQELRHIPYGSTCSYRDIAEAIGNRRAVRAVGQANHRNPLPIVVPCHRVVGANGKLVGYGGGLDLKQQLIELERANAA